MLHVELQQPPHLLWLAVHNAHMEDIFASKRHDGQETGLILRVVLTSRVQEVRTHGIGTVARLC